MERKRLKIFLTNGYKYSGFEISRDTISIIIKDDKDKKEREIPFSAIATIENDGGC